MNVVLLVASVALLGAWVMESLSAQFLRDGFCNAAVFPTQWACVVVDLFGAALFLRRDWSTSAYMAAHALGHAGAVIALGAGAVSFAQTVKAAEPVFTCVLSYFVLGTVFKWPVYASLIPIIGGVSLASLKELSFTWKALCTLSPAIKPPRAHAHTLYLCLCCLRC